MLTEQFAHLDYLEEAITRITAEIDQRLAQERDAVALLGTIPNVSQRTAEVLVAVLGTDSSRRRLVRRLEALGYTVSLNPTTPAA